MTRESARVKVKGETEMIIEVEHNDGITVEGYCMLNKGHDIHEDDIHDAILDAVRDELGGDGVSKLTIEPSEEYAPCMNFMADIMTQAEFETSRAEYYADMAQDR